MSIFRTILEAGEANQQQQQHRLLQAVRQQQLQQSQQAAPVEQQMRELQLQQAQAGAAQQRRQLNRDEVMLAGRFADLALQNFDDPEMRSAIVSGAAQRLGVSGVDPAAITKEQLEQFSLAGRALREPDRFTLSPGQTRFEDGRAIATASDPLASAKREAQDLDKQLKREQSTFDRATKLRSEVERFTKVFRDVEDSYARVKATQEGEVTAQSDLALIFGFMKMLDPTSVVREGEQASAENTRGISESILNTYNKVAQGERLSPAQRKRFIVEAEKQYDSARKLQERREKEYVTLGSRYGLERGDIITRETRIKGFTKQEYIDAGATPEELRKIGF